MMRCFLLGKWFAAHVLNSVSNRNYRKEFSYVAMNCVSRTADGERVLLQTNEMKLRGLHNVENVAGRPCGGHGGGAGRVDA